MHDWDGIADHVNPDMIAIDVLHYIADIRGAEPSSHRVPVVPHACIAAAHVDSFWKRSRR